MRLAEDMKAPLLIVSAKYGPILWETPIEYYEEVLDYDRVPSLARKIARFLFDSLTDEVTWYYKCTDVGAVPYMLAMYLGCHYAGVEFIPYPI